MTRTRKLTLAVVAVATAWFLADAIRVGGLVGLAVVITYVALGIWLVERLERRP